MRKYLLTTGGALLALAAPLAVVAADASANYVIANQGAIGLAKAFDDGQNTVLVFADLDSQTPVLSDAKGKTIKFRRVGDYAVLPGHFDDVKVDVAGAKGAVKVMPEGAKTGPSVTASAATEPLTGGVRAGSRCGTQGLLGQSADVTGVILTCKDGYWTAVATSPGTPAPLVAAPLPAPAPVPTHGSAPTGATAPQTSAAAVTGAPKAMVVPAAPQRPMQPQWVGDAGTDAKTMLMAWAAKAGWHVDWQARVTFPIPSPVSYTSTFEDAVREHFAVYTDRRRTTDAVCVDIHKRNVTVNVYPKDDSGKCKQPLPVLENPAPQNSQVSR